jgi:hypothetical protein
MKSPSSSINFHQTPFNSSYHRMGLDVSFKLPLPSWKLPKTFMSTISHTCVTKPCKPSQYIKAHAYLQPSRNVLTAIKNTLCRPCKSTFFAFTSKHEMPPQAHKFIYVTKE